MDIVSVLYAVMALLTISSVHSLPDANRMLTDPYNCEGFPEPRTYVEAQWWFTDTGKDINSQSEHLHMGSCLPVGDTFTGKFTLHVLVLLHNVIELYVDSVEIFAWLPKEDDAVSIGINETEYQCVGVNNCKTVYTLEVDTAKIGYNGRVSLLLTGSLSDVSDLRRARHSRASHLRYNRRALTEDAYTEASKEPPAPRDDSDSPPPPGVLESWLQLEFSVTVYNGPKLPMLAGFDTSVASCAKASAPWTYTCVTWDFLLYEFNWSGVVQTPEIETEEDRSDDPDRQVIANVTRTFISLDPSFHATPPVLGTILYDVSKQFDSTFFIDTTKLTNGVHKLFIRADSTVAAGVSPRFLAGGTLSGVLMVVFNASN